MGLAVGVARAQEADPATRVQRDASNPLRMIIEAGKLKPRQKPLDAEPAAPAAAEARPAPEVAVAPKPVVKPVPQTGTLRNMNLPDVAPVEVPAPALAATVLLERSEPVPQRSNDADDYFGAPPPPRPGAQKAGATTAGTSPTVERLALATTTHSAPADRAASAQSGARVAEPAQRETLQLADYIEPVVPERLRRRLQSDGEVVLEFTVNADGTVSDIAVRSASDKALEAVAVDAVRQWRYRPISTAQAHGAQLVFKLRP